MILETGSYFNICQSWVSKVVVTVDAEERQGLLQEIQEAVKRNRKQEADGSGEDSGDEWVDHSDMEDNCD